MRNLLTIASGDENLSKDKCCKYLTQVGLCANDYLDREVDVSLSGGEVKRIEIATLLARGGELMHRGSTKEIFPLIMADTLGSCPVLNK